MKNKGYLLMFVTLLFSISLVLAQDTSGDNSSLIMNVAKFLNFGDTWSEIFVMSMILLILFSLIYDVLSISSFSHGSIKVILSLAIALLATTQFGLSGLYLSLMKLVGEFFIISLFGLMLIAIVLFILAGWIKGKLKHFFLKDQFEKIEQAHRIEELKNKKARELRDARFGG